jgi:hypothetical protein
MTDTSTVSGLRVALFFEGFATGLRCVGPGDDGHFLADLGPVGTCSYATELFECNANLAIDIGIGTQLEVRKRFRIGECPFVNCAAHRDEPAAEIAEAIVRTAASDQEGRAPQVPGIRAIGQLVEDLLEGLDFFGFEGPQV